MDVAFGTVGVVSLAIELVEKIDQLYELIESAKAAPSSTASLLNRLQDISLALQEIQDDRTLDSSPSIGRALATCSNNIQQIRDLVRPWIQGFSANNTVARAWHKTRAARQASKVKDLENLLDSTKLTLIIAQNSAAR